MHACTGALACMNSISITLVGQHPHVRNCMGGTWNERLMAKEHPGEKVTERPANRQRGKRAKDIPLAYGGSVLWPAAMRTASMNKSSKVRRTYDEIGGSMRGQEGRSVNACGCWVGGGGVTKIASLLGRKFNKCSPERIQRHKRSSLAEVARHAAQSTAPGAGGRAAAGHGAYPPPLSPPQWARYYCGTWPP